MSWDKEKISSLFESELSRGFLKLNDESSRQFVCESSTTLIQGYISNRRIWWSRCGSFPMYKWKFRCRCVSLHIQPKHLIIRLINHINTGIMSALNVVSLWVIMELAADTSQLPQFRWDASGARRNVQGAYRGPRGAYRAPRGARRGPQGAHICWSV